MYFSWPVLTTLYIIYIDICSPGCLVDRDSASSTIQLMNSMCNLTKFVIYYAVRNINAEFLAKTFMEDIAMFFGMTDMVVVDSDSKFRSIFEEMCTALKIHYWPLAQVNHKGLLVKQYHRYLNKTQSIAGQDCGTHLINIQNSKTLQYDWNISPINNIDIPHSISAIGRVFRFSLYIELIGIPNLSYAKGTTLYNYFCSVSADSAFATSIVQVLVEEGRKAHAPSTLGKKMEPEFQIGDFVKNHVQVNSNAKRGVVKKLSYRARGTFQITAALGKNPYEVNRCNQPDSASRKYKGTELYLLLPNIFPCDPLNTTYQ